MKIRAKNIFLFFIILAGLFVVYHYFADRLLETIHKSSKPHDVSGAMIGEEAVEIKRGDAQAALIIIHGYTSSPSRFHHLITFLKSSAVDVDIYAPLLPFHGRALEEFKSFNNDEIKKFVKAFLDTKAKEYKKLVVIGESYGAAVLADLLQTSGQYPNAKFIFSSPGIFLNCNTAMQRMQIFMASKFMDYCPSCYGPYTTDQYSKIHARYAQKHGVVCFKSFGEMLKMDLIARQALTKIQNPYTIIASRDDDVVNIQALESTCAQNMHCTSFIFDDGGHFVHWGKYEENYKEYLLNALRN
jgi:esterase/lipase